MIPAEKIRAEALKHDAIISNQEGKQGPDGLGYANPNGEQAGFIARSRCGPATARGAKK
jgi:hypothetical protein